MTPRDYILVEYARIPPETTSTGQVCPKCRGGSSHERSLSVGRTGAFLWWRCHRASCQWVGKETVQGSTEPATHGEKKGKYERKFNRQRLPGSMVKMFYEQYYLDDETLQRAGWSYTPDYDGLGARVIIPMYGPDGSLRGEQFRSYDGHSKKALINGLLAENLVGWYRWRKYGKQLIIVEDAVSAVRVAQAGVDSLCLFGTTLSVDRAIEIGAQEYSKVYLSLDNDATTTAIKAVFTMRKYIPNLYIKPLEKDIKDMTPDELEVYLHGI